MCTGSPSHSRSSVGKHCFEWEENHATHRSCFDGIRTRPALGMTTSGPSVGAQPLDGRAIFRFDTFGSDQLWTDTLRLHEAIETLSPAKALAVGLKVDVDALPPAIITALTAGQVDLNDPAVTLQLLQTERGGWRDRKCRR